MNPIPKTFLGDAVYAEYDGYHMVLTTDNGYSATNRICLDPWVYQALTQYAEVVRKAREAAAEAHRRAPGKPQAES